MKENKSSTPNPVQNLVESVPRTFEGKFYYGIADVAKIIGVERRSVSRWNQKGIFIADTKTPDGYYLYEIERVMQLKEVYHLKWMRGKYKFSRKTIFSDGNDLIPPASVSDIIVKMKNYQIYPSKKIYIPNDALSKKLFSLTDEEYREAIEEEKVLSVTEKKNHKKFGDIITPFRIQIDGNNGFTVSEPLDQFHFALLCGYISEFYAGNPVSTPSIVFRAITGKVGTDATPHKDQLADILNGTDKLMRTQIGINMTNYCQKLNNDKNEPYTVASTILPCKRITKATINGKERNTIIYFDRESPLWEIATKIKSNQVLSFDSALLNVPKMQNTRMNIGIKFYILRRILEIKGHSKQMIPTITFDDVYEKCRLSNASRDKKCAARNITIKFFEHLQEENFVKVFQVNKKGVSPYSISFNF